MSGRTKKFALKNLKQLLIRQPVSASDKNNMPPSDIVTEAEQIIESYLKRLGYEKKAKKKKTAENIFTALIIIGFFATAYFVIRFTV